MRLIKDVSKVDDFIKRIKALDNASLEVGILSSEDGEILLIANVHEFGAPSVNIPERSFIRAGFDEHHKDIEQTNDKLLDMYLEGNISARTYLNTLGEYCVGLIQKFIVDLKEPPNKPATIEAKGSSNPLVDTGRLIQSISYQVKGV